MVKGEPQDELAKDLKEILSKHNDIIIPYSTAHIQDLLKGSDKEENIPLIESDLNFIDELSNYNNMQFEIKPNKTIPKKGSAHNLFKGFKESESIDLLNPQTLKDSVDVLNNPTLNKLIDTLYNQKIDVNFDLIPEESYGIQLRKYFRRSKIENTLRNLMLDYSEFHKDLLKDPKIYQELKKAFRNYVGIDINNLMKSQEPIKLIDDVLKASPINKNFDELSTIDKTGKNEINSSFYMKYILEFTNLDMSGYHSDKLKNKNMYSNFSNDTQHSFYGGHCDYFITKESKLIEKSNLLYSKYNISTKAIKPKDFVQEIKLKLDYKLEIQDLFEEISRTFEENLIRELEDYRTENSKIILFKPQKRILGYFNYAYYILRNNSRQTFFLRNISNSFSGFGFYDEFRSITNKLAKILGEDIYKHSTFENEEIDQIDKDEWVGRYWITTNYYIYLTFDNLANQLELYFEQLTDEFLEEIKITNGNN